MRRNGTRLPPERFPSLRRKQAWRASNWEKTFRPSKSRWRIDETGRRFMPRALTSPPFALTPTTKQSAKRRRAATPGRPKTPSGCRGAYKETVMDDNEKVATTERRLAELKKTSQDLKERIIEEKKRNAMPINASLGDPTVDARNADGRNDLPDQDDD
jgi:hypothetical protein